MPSIALDTYAAERGRPTLAWTLLGGAGCLIMALLVGCAGLGLAFYSGISDLDIPYPDGPPPATATALSNQPTPSNLLAGPSNGASVSGMPLTENFDRPERSTFVVDENEDMRYAFDTGGYLIEIKATDTLVWSLAEGQYSDVTTEVEVSFLKDTPLSAGGLVFYYQDERNFYLFSVTSEGLYSLELVENNEWITLIDWTETDGLVPTGQANRLRLEANGDQIALFLNGTRLELTSDGTFTKGEIGLAATSFDNGGVQARFDNLMVISGSANAPPLPGP